MAVQPVSSAEILDRVQKLVRDGSFPKKNVAAARELLAPVLKARDTLETGRPDGGTSLVVGSPPKTEGGSTPQSHDTMSIVDVRRGVTGPTKADMKAVDEIHTLIRSSCKTLQAERARLQEEIDAILFDGVKGVHPEPREISELSEAEAKKVAELRDRQKALDARKETLYQMGRVVSALRGHKASDDWSGAFSAGYGWGIPGIVWVGAQYMDVVARRTDETGRPSLAEGAKPVLALDLFNAVTFLMDAKAFGHFVKTSLHDVKEQPTLKASIKRVGRMLKDIVKGRAGIGAVPKLFFYAGYNPGLDAKVFGLSITGVGWLGAYWNDQVLGVEFGETLMPISMGGAVAHPKMKIAAPAVKAAENAVRMAKEKVVNAARSIFHHEGDTTKDAPAQA